MWDFLHIIGSISDDINCYEPGKYYGGNGLNDGRSTLTDSAKECQKLCKDNPACAGFTWFKDTLVRRERQCWLQSKMDTYGTNDDAVSGPKQCGMLILNRYNSI